MFKGEFGRWPTLATSSRWNLMRRGEGKRPGS